MSGHERRPLPPWQVIVELAKQALIRTLRGRTLWFAVAVAALPTVVALVMAGAEEPEEDTWKSVLGTCTLVLVVMPAVLVSSAVSDEIEDNTSAYLWSRALPRWTVVIGKLLALAPLCGLLLGGSALVAFYAGGLGGVREVVVDGSLGLAAAGVAAAAIAAMFGVLLPRHAVAVTIGWMMLIDWMLGTLDIRLHHLSTTFGALTIAGANDSAASTGAITLVVLAGIATAVACWRISKTE